MESDGCSLTWKVEGTGADSVVFIQGVGLHGDGWLPRTQILKADFRCLTFDNRGMGQGQPAGPEITVERMAEDTIRVMDAAGVDAAHLAGRSLGGAVALQVALAFPSRVRSGSIWQRRIAMLWRKASHRSSGTAWRTLRPSLCANCGHSNVLTQPRE